LNKIDWNKAETFALSSLVKTACDLWRDTTYNIIEISKKMKLHRSTIRRYLKQGTKLGWCNYDSKKEMNKINEINSKVVAVFKNGKQICSPFKSLRTLERESEINNELFGSKLYRANISKVCNTIKEYKGCTFKYIDNNKLNAYL
jgi:IS30 family transposase